MEKEIPVKQRVVFISGGNSDIGMALCAIYLSAGYKVIAHHRSSSTMFDDLCNSSTMISPYQLDFSKTGELEKSIISNNDLLQTVDVFVNLAAILESRPFNASSAASIISTLSVNLLPGLLLMQAMAPAMVSRRWGRIVHGSSIGVKFGGGAESFEYSLSKHAMEFIPSCALQWAACGVLINIARIGVTETKIHSNISNKITSKREQMIPMGRAATTQEIAKAIFWLGSDENSYITGQVIPISGGE